MVGGRWPAPVLTSCPQAQEQSHVGLCWVLGAGLVLVLSPGYVQEGPGAA